MNQEKIRQFIDSLRQQAEGGSAAVNALANMQISLGDGYCLFNLYEQWRGAFSFSPGRPEAIAPILSLAEKLSQFSSDDTLAMYRLPEWGQLVLLRGPVEAVLLERCTKCQHSYACMGTSGFYDANGLVCGTCGNVYFKSYYDTSESPRCACGSMFPDRAAYGCPKCGEKDAKSEGGMSPYEYFSTHTYQRGPGA